MLIGGSIMAATSVEIPDVNLGLVLTLFGIMSTMLGFFWAYNRNQRKWNRFYDDWYGIEATPGHPAVPGVIERLNTDEDTNAKLAAGIARVEKAQKDMQDEFSGFRTRVDGELSRNGGQSVKDLAANASRKIDEVASTIADEVQARKDWSFRHDRLQAMLQAQMAKMTAAVRQMIGMSPEDQVKLWDTLADEITGTDTGHEATS